jgi:hypothetical protein
MRGAQRKTEWCFAGCTPYEVLPQWSNITGWSHTMHGIVNVYEVMFGKPTGQITFLRQHSCIWDTNKVNF